MGQQHQLELSLRRQQGRIRMAEEVWLTAMQSLPHSTTRQFRGLQNGHVLAPGTTSSFVDLFCLLSF